MKKTVRILSDLLTLMMVLTCLSGLTMSASADPAEDGMDEPTVRREVRTVELAGSKRGACVIPCP